MPRLEWRGNPLTARGDPLAQHDARPRSSVRSPVQPTEFSDPCACGPAFAEAPEHGYNEAAFRYLLTTERQRAGRAGRSLLVLLVHLGQDFRARTTPSAVATLLGGLTQSLRESDVIGWYRDRRI